MSKFISFSILISCVDYYTRAKGNFRIRQAVKDIPLIINTDVDKLFRRKHAPSMIAIT